MITEIAIIILIIIVTITIMMKYDLSIKIKRLIDNRPYEEAFYIYTDKEHPIRIYNSNTDDSTEVFIIDSGNNLHTGCYNYKRK